jgi:hypothetical protein
VVARGWTNIGLVLEENSGEYALWALLRQELGREVRVEHVAVRNESRRLTGGRPFFPEAVLAETPVADPFPDKSFECLWREGPLRLFVPKEPTAKGWRQAAWKR